MKIELGGLLHNLKTGIVPVLPSGLRAGFAVNSNNVRGEVDAVVE
jgi:hypothetical protein